MEKVIIKTKDSYDSDDVRWTKGEGELCGYGYIGKESGKVGLIRCPECGKENYAMAVASGECVWCGFDAKK